MIDTITTNDKDVAYYIATYSEESVKQRIINHIKHKYSDNDIKLVLFYENTEYGEEIETYEYHAPTLKYIDSEFNIINDDSFARNLFPDADERYEYFEKSGCESTIEEFFPEYLIFKL